VKLGELRESDLLALCGGAGLTWRIHPFVIRVKTRLADVARGLSFLYGEFPLAEQDAVVDAELIVRRKLPWPGWVSIRVDGAIQYNWLRRRLVTPMIEWTINVCMFQRPHQYFMVHAGVVANRGRAAILPGRAGSGKSTLCAALIRDGWRLLSDEVALIRPTDGMIQPVPRPISLKEESIEVIRRFAPDAVLGPEWPGTSEGTVAHLLPPPDSVARAGETARPAWLLFPVFEKGAATTLVPVTKAAALMRTADNAFNYSVFGQQGFEMLSGLIDRCACYEFRYGDLADALRQFETIESAPHVASQTGH
jgi:HprK-related kinase A